MPPFNNLNHPNNFGYLDPLLIRFVPILVEFAYQYMMSPDNAARIFAYRREDTHGNFGVNGINSDELYRAYQILLENIQSASQDSNVSDKINDDLDASFRDDEQLVVYNGHYDHAHCLLYFQALAEISRQTDSLRLGRILSDFFFSRGEAIARNEANYVVLWSHAIDGARVPADTKRRCLGIILEYNPRVIDVLRSDPNPHAQALRRDFGRVYNELGMGDLRPSVRSMQRYGQHGFGSRGFSPVTHRDAWGLGSRSALGTSGHHFRSRSAIGHREINRQLNVVVNAATQMAHEAEELRLLAGEG